MRILALVHQDDARSGVFAEAAASAGHELDERSFATGERPDDPDGYGAAVVLGGGLDVHEEDEHPWLRDEKAFVRGLLEAGLPLFGVCLGSQLVAEAAGGAVRRLGRPEVGWHEVRVRPDAADDPLLGGAPGRFRAWQWHSYGVSPPDGATELAESDAGLQAYRVGDAAWGIQFHAEVTADTPGRWLGSYGRDADAREAGLDTDAARAETEREIARWNDFGRELFGRFAAAAGG